jgi:hypothetical protein
MDSNPDVIEATMPVLLSKELYTKVENRVKLSNGEFNSVEDYITFILTEVVKEEQDPLTDNVYTKEEDEEIKDRLRNLGYI